MEAIAARGSAEVLAMAKRSAPGPGMRGKPAYRIEDIDEMEKLTLEKANKALSAIENALAVWDASREKPEDLKPRISRLKYFYEALAGWERKVLKSMAKEGDMDTRIEHLREFSDICHAYA